MCQLLFGNGQGSLTTVGLARFPMKVEEGRNVSPRDYPAMTAFSSLNPGISGIDSVIAVRGVHKVTPCSEGTCSQALTIVSWTTPGNCASYWKSDGDGAYWRLCGGYKIVYQ